MPANPPDDLKPHFLTFDDLDGTIDWAQFFGNSNPVELDVGSGRGLFLVTAALEHPEINYLGLELDYKEGRRAARRLKKRGMPNARVLGGDCRVALQRHIPAGTVSAVRVYVPDPWWKRKHKRRRLFTDVFVDQIAAVLKPGGIVHAWTDVEDYFRIISALMDHCAKFEKLAAPSARQPAHDMDYQTSFERKKRQAGGTIHRGRWRLTT